MKHVNPRPERRPLAVAITLIVSALIAYGARAGEVRLLPTMPTANKTTAGEVTKSKKSGYKCDKVKQNAESGNPGKVKKSKSLWFTDVPGDQDDAANARLVEGKSAVRCTLMAFQNSKMRNADLGDTGSDD